ncbi:SET domain-containing protein-lysine N-methyltransferase [Pandoraea oxalativorans]|uniref:Post-SET domain-containing protein n=1 Tax=Pandoraea oxalativorans TaxID=573737 RepID=A0A0E3U5X9_9BURK|nr:SET domain-containing protein-lysine N-methyltransferase [Pandoraea oxalativorans]AKC69579.1 hypothetical protein MB84_08950 [Pandoraea oxalativorans]
MGERHFSQLFEVLKGGYPSGMKFEICRFADGSGVRTRVPFVRAQLVSRITGMLTNERKLHTLQVSETTHLYDPEFSGMLLHSCSPCTVLDMKRLEMFALRDIGVGEFLTIDYASTEETLARQFKCACGAPNCRGWVTGYRELPNEEGIKVLAEFGAGMQPHAAK